MGTSYKSLGSIKKICEDALLRVREYDFSALSDAEIKEKMNTSETDEEILALTTEAIFRLKGLRLFDCQIVTAYALFSGHLAELPTGEGKTLSAVLAAILFSKKGRKVHILVFNDYLAMRDGIDNKEIFDFFGIKSGYITEKTEISDRVAAYKSEVLYISAREAGYDCIRDFVAKSEDELTGGQYDVAIVDEADSILIDEASIPLVLAGKAEEKKEDEQKTLQIVNTFCDEDYEISEQEGQIWLTDNGIKKVEQALFIDDLYSDENFDYLSNINTALEAVFKLKKDKDYIVKDGKILVIDESTGRVSVGRKFPNALQIFVELKEGITDNFSTKIYCTMTVGAFMSQYKTLSGMTGTAATSASEFESTYSLRTVVIEPHIPSVRQDLEDELFETNAERNNAAVAEILKANQKGQPVLVGTSSVKESEILSELLTEKNVKHNVLNARNDELEAEMIAEAGKPFAVTVSTNMAGRGVDIKLGGKNEEEKEKVLALGGLYIISTAINKSRRIDNQLRGRAGRQGDAGVTKFFISLEDETISPFFDDDQKENKKLSLSEKFSLVRSAQQTCEGNEAEARYTLKKYSYIIEYQRQYIADYRLKILKGEETPDVLKTEDIGLYTELVQKVGQKGIELAEKSLMLYYINYHFANYLSAMEDFKSGVHLTVVAGKNPFDEFNRTAISAFEEMKNDIRFDVLKQMRESEITENGIDMAEKGLIGATGTWTYMVDDSAGQFSHLPALLKMVTKKIKEKVPFKDRLENFFTRRKNK